MSSKQDRGIPIILARITRCRERLCVLTEQNRLRDLDQIWEAYYDVEESILLSKVIFGGFDKPGKIRKLIMPANFDFAKLSDLQIRAIFESVEKNLTFAQEKLLARAEEETIELLRRARDDLKMIQLKPRKYSRRNFGRRKSVRSKRP